MSNKYTLNGTKAETLQMLSDQEFNIPKVFYFSVDNWKKDHSKIIQKIISLFQKDLLAVRSSSQSEDLEFSSMAGAYESILNVQCNFLEVLNSVNKVIRSFDDDDENQVLVQPMVVDVQMSGVAMTKVMDDGSPYYTINYDLSGSTESVTGGSSINKTVYIYNGVEKKDFDSNLLLKVLELIKKLENIFPNNPLDIEFAINNSNEIFLLQVRKITTIKKWNLEANKCVSERIIYLKDYIDQLMSPRPNIYGQKTLLGFMPDWNPAEMIGIVPNPLAISLYRELITSRSWSIARERMGYREMPNIELMISLFGRPYIDVRNSINSFLPKGLSSKISKKVVNAYLNRLSENPQFHDKIEFEIVQTAYDFDIRENLNNRYPNLLSENELEEYTSLLHEITLNSLLDKKNNSLNLALNDINKLQKLQKKTFSFGNNSFLIADKISSLIDECINLGTIPFSIIARHGFIAESLIRSALNNKVFSEKRLSEFRKSIITISSEMSSDFNSVLENKLSKKMFLSKYGHLRPSSYDILSPNYKKRKDLFDGLNSKKTIECDKFELNKSERSKLKKILKLHNFSNITPNMFMNYAEKSIKGREYAKFIFTKHLSIVLEGIADWGEIEGFNRREMAMLSVGDLKRVLYSPLDQEIKSYYRQKVKKAELNLNIASSFKLSYLIRSTRDIFIVPMQRSLPNFVGNKRIESEIVFLTPHLKKTPLIENKIVLIEGADPGYDWIFTKNISGLITKYGGANSHMAIRCSEYGLPAAIGCGEQTFEQIINAKKCLLDCQGKRLEKININ